MATLVVTAPPSPPRTGLVAPLWHTALLVAFMLAMAAAGAAFQHAAQAHPAAATADRDASRLYLSLIAGEWGLVYYVWKGGLRRTGTSLRELIGGRWSRARDVFTDLALGLGLWGTWLIVGPLLERVLAPGHAASIDSMLPTSPLEIALWIALSLSAGFCEEVVFRGYLQRQFAVLTGGRWPAWLLVAVLFGISHGYQGVQACVRITIFGALFGLLALWRRSLRPGILAHAWTDIAAGLIRI
jgi:membrane protease YdiL (CAAX protease family)